MKAFFTAATADNWPNLTKWPFAADGAAARLNYVNFVIFDTDLQAS